MSAPTRIGIDDPARAALALDRYYAAGGDPYRLLGQLSNDAPRPLITAIDEITDDRPPVVRYRPNAAPHAAMVAAWDELERNET